MLFEAAPRLGGHAHTVDVTLPRNDGRPVTHGVDVGFLVFNERTYPGFIALLDALGVKSARSDMSFSVQASGGLSGRGPRLEWNGANLDAVFAQRRNLLSPAFWRMLADILRFNRLATALARGAASAPTEPLETVARFLERHRFSSAFREGYLLPMVACIWSCPLEQMLRYPMRSLAEFCDNHGLLQVDGRPAWYTVAGGSRHYVDAIAATLPAVHLSRPVQSLARGPAGELRVLSAHGAQAFDAVVLACHAPQSARLLASLAPGDALQPALSALRTLRTQANRAVLHTDTTLLPQRRKAWAAWNFERGHSRDAGSAPVCLHYWINRLQPLPFATDVIVSLNPLREPARASVLWEGEVEHPVFDAASFEARAALQAVQGRGAVWFAGAWCGHGFHEDGLRAGQAAAQGLLQAWHAGRLRPVESAPWEQAA